MFLKNYIIAHKRKNTSSAKTEPLEMSLKFLKFENFNKNVFFPMGKNILETLDTFY